MSTHTEGYRITPDGRVFSVAHNWRGYGERELVQSLNSHGYPSVRLSVNGRRLHYAVHSLVAGLFLSPRPSLAHEVRHLDGDKRNNNVTNLAWGTRKENANDRSAHGRTSRGERHSLSIKASAHAEGIRAYQRRKKESASV